jgi:hypothetical protein
MYGPYMGIPKFRTGIATGGKTTTVLAFEIEGETEIFHCPISKFIEIVKEEGLVVDDFDIIEDENKDPSEAWMNIMDKLEEFREKD